MLSKYLRIDHGNADPVIAPHRTALGAEIKKFLTVME